MLVWEPFFLGEGGRLKFSPLPSTPPPVEKFIPKVVKNTKVLKNNQCYVVELLRCETYHAVWKYISQTS